MLQRWQVSDYGGLLQGWQIDDNKSNNNKDKNCLFLIKMKLLDHMLDYVFNYIIIGVMTTALYWNFQKRKTSIGFGNPCVGNYC